MTRELDEALYGFTRSLDDELFAGGEGKMILDSPDYPPGQSLTWDPGPPAGTVAKGGGIQPSSYSEPFPGVLLGGTSSGKGGVQTGYSPPSPTPPMPTVERPIPQSLRGRGIRICIFICDDGSRQVLR